MPRPEKIAVPEDRATPYTIPEGLSKDDAEWLIAEAKKEAAKLLSKDDARAEDVERAEWLISANDALGEHITGLVAAETEHAERVAAVRAKLGGENAATDDHADETDEQKAERERAEAEAANGTGAGADGGVGNLQAPEPVLVASKASAGRRSAIRDAARAGGGSAVAIPAGQPREAFLTAASNVPGFNAGQKLNGFGDMGTAAFERFRQFPDGPSGAPQTLPIGRINIPTDEGLVASKMVTTKDGRGFDLDSAIDWALSPKRLEQETGEQSLTAAGGWCAPSETLYDLVDLTTADGMIDIPGITVSRGGVRYSLGPDFSAVYSAGQNFTKTEAQAIAGSAKPVVNIPCPTFTDNRMVVDGMYLTGDILSAKGYPEAYADFIAKATKAFAHYVNAASIAAMVTAATAVDLQQPGSSPTYYESKSASTELLGAVELQIVDMRYKNRLSLTQMVELKLPVWAKGVIRSDLSRRANVDNPANITDAMIDTFFTERGANCQFVYDWQDYFATGSGLGAATPAKAWPGVLQFLLYPQGTFVRALSDVIELNAVYDSTLLTTNQYVALFMEQARLVLKRSWDARVCTVKVPITGAVGAAIDYTALQPTV